MSDVRVRRLIPPPDRHRGAAFLCRMGLHRTERILIVVEMEDDFDGYYIAPPPGLCVEPRIGYNGVLCAGRAVPHGHDRIVWCPTCGAVLVTGLS